MRSQFDPFPMVLIDRDHFEPIERYRPTEELLQVARRLAPPDWSFRVAGPWTACFKDDHNIPAQGWKIHISATPSTAIETLERVVPVLVSEGVLFKFSSDLFTTAITNSKNWYRGASGKFLAAYPESDRQFIDLVEQCHQATRELAGPYVLSDRRYKDSKAVFYRYGGFKDIRFMNVYGEWVPAITTPGGNKVADVRAPFFYLPDWVGDPFAAQKPANGASGDDGKQGILLKNRYRVKHSLRFSNRGGIYEAEDLETGRPVVVREARPLVVMSHDGKDAIAILQEEARLLQRLDRTGYAPKFVDLFQEWEHLFLVEERVDGQVIFNQAMTKNLEYTYHTAVSAEYYYDNLCKMARKLVTALKAVHDCGVVLRDFTKDNVMVTDDWDVKFIDFEMAYDLRREQATFGFTPGYASPQQLENRPPSFADDYYALGALLWDTLLFNVQFRDMYKEGADRALREFISFARFPQSLGDAILGLMEHDPDKRWSPEAALQVIEEGRASVSSDGAILPPSNSDRETAHLDREVAATLDGVKAYLLKKADTGREDRLWPSNPRLYHTNPLGILHGACGTAYYLLRSEGFVPDDIMNWILNKLDGSVLPPGLYGGLAGVSWFLADAGLLDRASDTLKRSYDPELVFKIPDVIHGAAGWGLANIHLWQETADGLFLDRAIEAGDFLLKTAKEDPDGYYWENDGTVYYGYGHGSSGVATFLLFLYVVEGSPRYLRAATRAMEFDAARGLTFRDKLVWLSSTDLTPDTGPKFPHWRYGSAGVGSALIRFYAATREPRYLDLAEKCANACNSRFSNKVWQCFGSGAFGEFFLDLLRFTGDPKYLAWAYDMAEVVLLYRVPRPEGIAFPGVELLKITCDFGTGIAGTGLFLHRMLNPHLPRLLTPDYLLADRIQPAPTEYEEQHA
jgi:serine/threonine protein kinase